MQIGSWKKLHLGVPCSRIVTPPARLYCPCACFALNLGACNNVINIIITTITIFLIIVILVSCWTLGPTIRICSAQLNLPALRFYLGPAKAQIVDGILWPQWIISKAWGWLYGWLVINASQYSLTACNTNSPSHNSCLTHSRSSAEAFMRGELHIQWAPQTCNAEVALWKKKQGQRTRGCIV